MKYAFVPFQKYATFSGRARRAEYWQFTLATALISLALTGLDALTGTYSVATGFGFLSGLFSLALIVPFAALYARRFHDFGWSTWWLLILLVPVANVAFLLVLGFKDSDVGENRYGPSPKPKPETAVGAETPAAAQDPPTVRGGETRDQA